MMHLSKCLPLKILLHNRNSLILPSSAQFQLSEVEAEMVFIFAISTHLAKYPGKCQNCLEQLIIGKESC